MNVHEFDILEHPLRVKGDTHIGGVIIQLVEQLHTIRNDWSDFALWWPDKNQWLNKTKMTLDQYGVQADALLHFTRLHKSIRVRLPDQQVVHMKMDASVSLFAGIKKLCKDLDIRHAEEVSLLICHKSTLRKASASKNTSKTISVKSESAKNHIQTSQSLTMSSKDENNLSSKESGSLSSSSTLNNTLSTNSNGRGPLR